MLIIAGTTGLGTYRTIDVDRYASELDAAERRGWIAALEWVCAHGGIIGTVNKLAELKAEENK